MILALKDDLSQDLTATPEALADPLSTLLRADRQGDHLLTLSRKASPFLLDAVAPLLSLRDRGMLFRVADREMSHGAWTRHPHLTITATGVPARAHPDLPYVPWRWFSAQGRGAPTLLVAEMLGNDAEIYARIANQVPVDGASVRLEIQGGGGNQTGANWAARARERVAIAVVDPDRRAPKTQVKETCRDAREAARRVRASWEDDDEADVDGPEAAEDEVVAHLVVLRARTIESIIPPDWYIHAGVDIGPHAGRLPLLAPECRWVNRKTGVECRHITRADAEAEYLRGLLAVPESFDCGKHGDGPPIQPCKEKIVPGLGEKALERVRDWLVGNPAEAARTIGESPELQRVATRLAWWGAASAPTPAP